MCATTDQYRQPVLCCVAVVRKLRELLGARVYRTSYSSVQVERKGRCMENSHMSLLLVRQ